MVMKIVLVAVVVVLGFLWWQRRSTNKSKSRA